MSSLAFDRAAIIFEEHRIPSGTPGIELYLRNKRHRDVTTFSPEKTIVMVHGATFSSGSLYDVPLGGMSFIDFLAVGGYDVFAVDVRGYGLSTRPPEMEAVPPSGSPLVGTAAGIDDFGAAVDYVLGLRKLSQVNVFAMSWGGTVAGAYAAGHPDKVVKLALLAPQWLSDAPIPIDGGGPLDAYRLVPVLDAKARWLSTVPEHKANDFLPDGWFEQWAQYTLAEDPWSSSNTPNRIRATNGPIQDIRDYWRAGKPFYRPSTITAPTLLVHGEWDIDVPIDLALAYFKELRSARYRKWVEIGEATHLLLLEKNRLLAFEAIRSFFDEAFASGF